MEYDLLDPIYEEYSDENKAVSAYVEWQPSFGLAKFSIIYGCGFLLLPLHIHLHACEFSNFSSRKRPSNETNETTSEFDSAMSSIFQIFMDASREFLVYKAAVGKSNQDSGPYELANLIHLLAS